MGFNNLFWLRKWEQKHMNNIKVDVGIYLFNDVSSLVDRAFNC